jgi:fructose-bisphosphate aldolase class 1
MSSSHLENVARALVAEGKGILAADEAVPTLTKRFQTLGIQSTEQSRRTYREMLFTCPDAAKSTSGAIMFDETIRQNSCPAGQQALYRRVSFNGSASVGKYTAEMEAANVDDPPHRRDWRDD